MSSTGNRAFTVVELMVVVVIVSVLATMVVPRLHGSAASARLRSAASRLLVTAQYGRDFAARRRCQCRLMFDLGRQCYALAYQTEPGRRPNEFRPLRSGLGRTERLGESLRFGKLWIEPRRRRGPAQRRRDWITFDPTGQADAAVLEITDGRRSYSIVVAPHTGRARLAEGKVRELPNDRRDLDLDPNE